jgi:enoyl-CoA hydratase/carnithine racemase
MDAATALRYGLVNEVVPAGDLDRCVTGWTDDLIRAAPLAVRAVKEAVLRSVDMPLEQAFTTRYHWEERRMRSQDAVEGPRAFAEKREPRWLGR